MSMENPKKIKKRRFIASRRAFSLVECLVCIFVIGVVLSLAVPVLRTSRARARQNHCVQNIRQAGLAIQAYSVDARDLWPNGGPVRREVLLPGNPHVYSVGGVSGLSQGRWSVLSPDSWRGELLSEAERCPRQPRYNPQAIFPAPEAISLSTYWMSWAMWLDPAGLAGDIPQLRCMATKTTDVAFPSQKVLLYEQVGYCIEDAAATFSIETLGQTAAWDTSTLAADGSAFRFCRNNGVPAVGSMPFDFTISGVRGRDISR